MNQERRFIQCGQFPLIARHANSVPVAAFNTLPAECAAINMVIQRKALGLAIQHSYLNGIGWTVHGAQTAACTSLHFQMKQTA